MTATNFHILHDHECVVIVSDAAAYDSRGVVRGLSSKVLPIVQWPGAVTGRGHSVVLNVVADHLSQAFQCFDDAVEGIATALPRVLQSHPWIPAGANAQIIIIGWSEIESRFAAYVIETDDSLPTGVTREQVEALVCSGAGIQAPPLKLQRLPDQVWGPLVTVDTLLAFGHKSAWKSDTPEDAILNLRRIIEYQRHQDTNGYGCRIGGWVQLTTVTRDSITQRILDRWEEDTVGFLLEPEPIVDWSKWHDGIHYTPGIDLKSIGSFPLQKEISPFPSNGKN